MEGQTSSQTPNVELRILSALLNSRSAYDQIKDLLGDKFTDPFSPLAKISAELIQDFYSRDGSANSCGKDILLGRLENKGLSSKHLEAAKSFVHGLDESVSIPNLLYDIREQRLNRLGDQIAGKLANRERGGDLQELIRKYQELGEEGELSGDDTEGSIYQAVPLGQLLGTNFSGEGTIPFGLPKLNWACDGGARAGHHIVITARPELGKTGLALDIISYPLSSGHIVVYVGNEEPMPDIILRMVGRLSGLSKDEIRRDPEKAERIALNRGYGGFVGASLSPGNLHQIDRLVVKYKPSIVVVDQIRNLDVKDDNRVSALEKAAIGIRNLAKSRKLVGISLTQAGDSAEGNPFPGMSDIDSSKTGIPGAIDLGIGYGATEEYKRAGIRGVNLFKNKLGGKHEQFLIRVNPVTWKVEEAS